MFRGFVMIVFASLFLVIAFGSACAQQVPDNITKSDVEEIKDYFLDLIERESSPKLDVGECYARMMLRGVRGCDEYASVVIGDEAVKRLQESFGASYAGIGSSILSRNGNFVLVPFVGSPADNAGIEPGDILLQVDSVEIGPNITLAEARNLIVGPAGTTVDLIVFRDGSRVGPIRVVRDNVSQPGVSAGMASDSVGYIRIYGFTRDVSKLFKEEVEHLFLRGAKSLIVDLRYNPGGIIGEPIAIAEMFAPSGFNRVVSTKNRGKTKSDDFAIGSGDFYGTSLVVLVNEFSASASELLAGTMKDWGVATVVGDTTFGKGSVQSWITATTRNRVRYYIKLTVAEYFVGNSEVPINGIGVTPDEVVKDSADWRDDPMVPRGQMNIDLQNDKALKRALEILGRKQP